MSRRTNTTLERAVDRHLAAADVTLETLRAVLDVVVVEAEESTRSLVTRLLERLETSIATLAAAREGTPAPEHAPLPVKRGPGRPRKASNGEAVEAGQMVPSGGDS